MGSYKVTFVDFGSQYASARLRAQIPQEELAKLGVKKGLDIIVYGKHFLEGFPKVKSVYDICDDYFKLKESDYYRTHAAHANAVTVNSDAMRDIVKRETGINSTVIPDPYESSEQTPHVGKGLFWFGHKSNLHTLEPYKHLNITVLTGKDWSRGKQLAMLRACSMVVLPTDARAGKSANRMIEAIRNGCFVVAGELPAHDEFRPFMWVGDIEEGVSWAQDHRQEALERIKSAQDYIRDKYAPKTVAKQWKSTLDRVWTDTLRK